VTRRTAANVALALCGLAWPLMAYGLLSRLADPAPDITREQIASAHQISNVVLLVGVVALLGAAWLAGYSFSEARWRAVFVSIACIVPLIYFILGTL
jgi:Na+/phosphate symporter